MAIVHDIIYAMTYRDYITSDLWRIRKRRYFETHERKCRACASRKRIHLHHKTYRRLGEERDADLVPLCHSCHTTLHIRQKNTGENLWRLTEEFINNKKRRYKNSRTKKRPTSKRKPRR